MLKYKKYSSDGTIQECYYNGELFAVVGKVSSGNWRGNLKAKEIVILYRPSRKELAVALLDEYLKLIKITNEQNGY
jgi:hypothetical protein